MGICRAGLLSLMVAVASLHALSGQAGDAPTTAEGIMARVAANQDRAEAERSHYVYVQHSRVISRKGKTVQCEEVMDSRMTPTSDGTHAEMLTLDGRVLRKKGYFRYSKLLPADAKGGEQDITIAVGEEEMDRQIVEHLRANLMNSKSKDGIGARLFPLTTKSQAQYAFELAGRERLNGREVFHVRFWPKAKDEFGLWKGDAFVDTAAYQPVVVRTEMARKIPIAVRTLLGTNVPGLGFTVVYAPQGDGVWFPASFGTEFKMHILFFFNREIVMNAENRSFEKTHVSARILEGGGVTEPTGAP